MSETNPTPPGIPYATPSSPYEGPAPDEQSKQMASLAHFLGILGPVPPLIIWILKKETMPFVNDQAKEVLNFNITLLCVYIPVFIVSMISGFIPIVRIVLPCILGLALLGMAVYAIILLVKGGMAAKTGVAYRYPYNFRFIK